MSSPRPTKDWRYCKCGHQPDDHNPISFACFLCDCDNWTADMEKSRSEGIVRIHEENAEFQLRGVRLN